MYYRPESQYGEDFSTMNPSGVGMNVSGQPTDMSPVSFGAESPVSSGMPDWAKAGIAGGAAAGIGSMFGGFGGESGEVGSGAGGYLEQLRQMLPQYFQPYQKMLDPTSLMKQFGSQYQASPDYQYQLSQALKGIGQASASGGMAGSPMQQQQAGEMARGMASKDYGNYMQRALGLYGQGAQGYRGLGEDLASSYLSEAQLAQMQDEEEAKQQEQSSSDMWGGIGDVAALATQIPW